MKPRVGEVWVIRSRMNGKDCLTLISCCDEEFTWGYAMDNSRHDIVTPGLNEGDEGWVSNDEALFIRRIREAE